MKESACATQNRAAHDPDLNRSAPLGPAISAGQEFRASPLYAFPSISGIFYRAGNTTQVLVPTLTTTGVRFTVTPLAGGSTVTRARWVQYTVNGVPGARVAVPASGAIPAWNGRVPVVGQNVTR